MAFPTEDSFLYSGHLKKKILKWRVLTAIAALLALLAVASKYGGTISGGNAYIAKINVNGVILEDNHRDQVIEKLADNDQVKALIVYINSPGGSIVGGEGIYNAIKKVSEKKPVVSVMGSVAASGGYMAAVAGDHIIAHNGTLTGSIGVLFQAAEITELAKKIGVNFITFKSSPYKAVPLATEKLPKGANKVIGSLVKDSYNFFVEIVDTEREMLTTKEVLALADGRVFTGRQAKEVRLVDAIGSEETAIDWLVKEKNIDQDLATKVVSTKKEPQAFEGLIQSLLPDFLQKMQTSGELVQQTGIMAYWDGK